MQLHTTKRDGTLTISASGNIEKEAFAKALTNAASDGAAMSVALQVPMLTIKDASQIPSSELAHLMTTKTVSIKKTMGQEIAPDEILNLVNRKSTATAPVPPSPSASRASSKITSAVSLHTPLHKVTMAKPFAPAKTQAELNHDRAIASAKMFAANRRGDVKKAERPINPDADREKVLMARAYAKARDEGTLIQVYDPVDTPENDMVAKLESVAAATGNRNHASALDSAKRFAEMKRQGQSVAL